MTLTRGEILKKFYNDFLGYIADQKIISGGMKQIFKMFPPEIYYRNAKKDYLENKEVADYMMDAELTIDQLYESSYKLASICANPKRSRGTILKLLEERLVTEDQIIKIRYFYRVLRKIILADKVS